MGVLLQAGVSSRQSNIQQTARGFWVQLYSLNGFIEKVLQRAFLCLLKIIIWNLIKDCTRAMQARWSIGFCWACCRVHYICNLCDNLCDKWRLQFLEFIICADRNYLGGQEGWLGNWGLFVFSPLLSKIYILIFNF